MTMLDSLLGGGQKQELDDFVNRYDQGAPWEGISDQEAIGRYQQVATQVSPDVFQQSAQDALSRLTPEQRAQFGEFLQQQAQARGVNVPGFGTSAAQMSQDPRQLAQATTQLNQQQPGLLGELLGGLTGGAGAAGGAGGMGGADLGGLLGGLGGSSTATAGQSSGTGAGSLLASPIAKAVLAGIAAMAVKQLSQRR